MKTLTKPDGGKVKPDAYLDLYNDQAGCIIRLHEVRDPAKVKAIKEDLLKNGWTGRPLLIYETPDKTRYAFTGSHRLAAIKEISNDINIDASHIKVPVKKIDPERLEKYAEENDVTIDDILSGDDYHKLDVLEEIDPEAARLMEEEIDALDESFN